MELLKTPLAVFGLFFLTISVYVVLSWFRDLAKSTKEKESDGKSQKKENKQ